jgi:hypothetical protein
VKGKKQVELNLVVLLSWAMLEIVIGNLLKGVGGFIFILPPVTFFTGVLLLLPP